MSDLSFGNPFDGATRVPVWTRPSERNFAAAAPGAASSFSAWAAEPAAPVAAEAPAEMFDAAAAEALMAEGYAIGLEEGRRQAEQELAPERAALAALAAGLETLQPEPPAALAAVLATTVRRLVAQVVGEVEIDAGLLAERTGAVAALILDDAGPARLRLNPADVARLADAPLAVELSADPALAPGTIVMETSAGWVEDGPAMRLDRLRTALDRMGCPQ